MRFYRIIIDRLRKQIKTFHSSIKIYFLIFFDMFLNNINKICSVRFIIVSDYFCVFKLIKKLIVRL